MAQREDGLDLDYLSDEPKEKKPPRSGEVVSKGSLGKDFYKEPSAQGGTSHGAMARTLTQMSFNTPPLMAEVEMKTVDVKSNYAKDRVEVFGDLILKFDINGICKLPVHQLPELAVIQRAKPGRFTVVVAEAPVAAPVIVAPVTAPKPVVEESAPVEAPAPVVAKEAPVKKAVAKKKSKGAVVKPSEADKFYADKDKS